jgi:hypothetical protein
MKITLSEVKQIIKEEVDRFKKIQLLEFKKKSIEKELNEFLKEIEEEDECWTGMEEEGISDSLTNKKGKNAKPNVEHLENAEEEMEESISTSLANRQGQNKKPETPHKKVRYGLKK